MLKTMQKHGVTLAIFACGTDGADGAGECADQNDH